MMFAVLSLRDDIEKNHSTILIVERTERVPIIHAQELENPSILVVL